MKQVFPRIITNGTFYRIELREGVFYSKPTDSYAVDYDFYTPWGAKRVLKRLLRPRADWKPVQ